MAKGQSSRDRERLIDRVCVYFFGSNFLNRLLYITKFKEISAAIKFLFDISVHEC